MCECGLIDGAEWCSGCRKIDDPFSKSQTSVMDDCDGSDEMMQEEEKE